MASISVRVLVCMALIAMAFMPHAAGGPLRTESARLGATVLLWHAMPPVAIRLALSRPELASLLCSSGATLHLARVWLLVLPLDLPRHPNDVCPLIRASCETRYQRRNRNDLCCPFYLLRFSLVSVSYTHLTLPTTPYV